MRTISLLVIVVLIISCEELEPLPDSNLWPRTYGGSGTEYGYGVQQTSDGGFAVAGWTDSFGAGNTDIWLLRIKENGDSLWSCTYGGSDSDIGRALQQTSDGGFIIVGYTDTYSSGDLDAWLVRTNDRGDIQWHQTYGGSYSDVGYDAKQTTDGGFIIAGSTDSYGADSSNIWLIRTDSEGDTVWTYTFNSGIEEEIPIQQEGRAVDQTNDGGFIVAGDIWQEGISLRDILLVRTDASGNLLWSQTYGGIGNEQGYDVQETFDGGLIVVGHTSTYGAGSSDAWLIRTDANGSILWTHTYGGEDGESAHAIQQTNDGGFIITGYTCTYGAGYTDIWLIRTNTEGDTLWTRTFGGYLPDVGNAVLETIDGGFIVAGMSSSYGSGDLWLMRTDSNGN